MSTSVADLRREYTRGGLTEADASIDPMDQFAQWFHQATRAGFVEPNVMTLSTATPEGRPSARTILLKGYDHRGFIFYSNYQSRKGRQLAENPYAALVFWWDLLERQVCIEGKVEKVSAEESDEYFHSRPEQSRLGTWVSEQSQVIPGRSLLETRFADVEKRFEGQQIPRPEYWGGYVLRPDMVEFWQGRPGRLHDRLRYRHGNGGWVRERLSP